MNRVQIRESRADFDDRDIADALGFCKEKVLEVVQQLLDRVMDAAELQFDEQSRNPREADQAMWKTSINLMNSQRQDVKQRFVDSFSRCFESENPRDFWKQELAKEKGYTLELLDTQVFERELLVERVAVRAGIDTQLHFNHLNRRLCFLLNRRIKPADNPLGPHLIARMMLKVFSSIGLKGPVLYELIRAMEDYFTNGLGQLYSDLNAELVRRGVLPDMKHHIWRTADSLHGGRGKSRPAMTESQRKAMAVKQEALADEDVGTLLPKLAGREPDSSRDPEVGRQFKQAGSQLLAAMDHLEAEMDGSETLVETLNKLHQEQQVEGMDETTRQIMARADALAAAFQKPVRRNPASLQASLAGRMSLHIGRMAVVDPGFLINKDHSARKALLALRQFADYLEISDPGFSQVMVGRFEDYLGHFEAACAEQESMEELQLFLEKEREKWKAQAKLNLSRLDGWFSHFARIIESRDSLNSELETAAVSAELDLYARLQLPRKLATSERSGPLLTDVQEEFKAADAAEVRGQLLASGLLGTLLQMQQSSQGSLEVPGQSHFEAYETPVAQDFAHVVENLRPGTWVQDLERQDEMQLPELKRFFRAYGKGLWCVFVDGMGEYAGAMSAPGLCSKIKSGLVKPLGQGAAA